MFHGDILKLREKRAALVKEANTLLSTAKQEKRDMTAAEAEKFDNIHAEVDGLGEQIKREERQLHANGTIEQRSGFRPGDVDPNREERQMTEDDKKAFLEKRNQAITGFLRYGMADLPPEQRALVQGLWQSSPEMRAASAGTNSAGGYTIAPDTSFYGSIVEGMKMYALDENLFDVLSTDTGAALPIPTNDDTANSGGDAAENTDNSGGGTDLTFGQITVNAYMKGTGLLKVSNVLIQDSSVDVEKYLGKKLGERMGRKKAADLTTGAGGGAAPTGIVTAATLGVTAASTTAITWQELVDLKHSVDPAHRAMGKWMFHDTTYKGIKKLTDSQGRPLYLAGIAVGSPDTIDGDPFVINQNMATPATGNKTVLYGNFKQFLVRNVRGFAIQRLVERFAEFNQTAFIGFSRYDSVLLDAGDHPIKYLKQA